VARPLFVEKRNKNGKAVWPCETMSLDAYILPIPYYYTQVWNRLKDMFTSILTVSI